MRDMGEVWERTFESALEGADSKLSIDEVIERAIRIADRAAQVIEDRRRARFERGTVANHGRPPGWRLYGRGLRGCG